MDQIKIGKFIANLRKEQNMTQLDLATKLGITDRAVSKWENGRGLPDISLITPLCKELSISVNELLNGERIAESQTVEIANQNIIGVLTSREKEIKKRKYLKALIAVLLCFTVAFGAHFGVILYNTVRGEGYTLFAAYDTYKAECVAKYIADGEFDKASKNIAFNTDDREGAERKWCDQMESLSETLTIKEFTVSRASADDWFVSGDAMLMVYDIQNGATYVYYLEYTYQNGGIAFGVENYIQNDTRAGELCEYIESVLCTWYAG